MILLSFLLPNTSPRSSKARRYVQSSWSLASSAASETSASPNTRVNSAAGSTCVASPVRCSGRVPCGGLEQETRSGCGWSGRGANFLRFRLACRRAGRRRVGGGATGLARRLAAESERLTHLCAYDAAGREHGVVIGAHGAAPHVLGRRLLRNFRR